MEFPIFAFKEQIILMEELSHIQVFLSYASADQERVLPIYNYLIKNGYPNAWIDCKKLLPGQPWEFEIQRALRKSEIVLLFLSHQSVNKRGYVQRELKTALKLLEEKLSSDIYMIPIKLDKDVLIPEELSKIQWLELERTDALSLLKKSIDEQAEKLGFDLIKGEDLLDEIHVIKRVTNEKWDGLPGYELEFSIPIFHSTSFENIGEISKIIEANFIRSLHFHRKAKTEQMPDIFSWAQFHYQRTNTYDAHFKSIFHKNNFLSIVYLVSCYGAGAAHPNHHFETFNYLLTPLFQVDDITEVFKDPTKSFLTIQEYVQKILKELPLELDENGKQIGDEKLLDEEWLKKGTESWKDFSSFAFSEEGLTFYFPPYQVGAYACGANQVTIPNDLIYKDMKTDFRHALALPTYD